MIEQDLKDYLASQTGVAAIIGSGEHSKVFDHVARESVDYPFLVIDEDTGQSSNTLQTGPSGLARSDFTVIAYALDKTEASMLWAAVRTALAGYGPAVMGSTFVHSALIDGAYRSRGFVAPQDASQEQVYFASSVYDIWHNEQPVGA